MGGKRDTAGKFPVDETVLDAYRATQDRQFETVAKKHVAQSDAQRQREEHRARLQALRPVLDAWVTLMRAGDIPRASEGTPGLERFSRKLEGCRLACKCERDSIGGGRAGGWVGSFWYALLTNGQWWSGYTVDSYLGLIKWGSTDARLSEQVALMSLSGNHFVPLDGEWSVKASPDYWLNEMDESSDLGSSHLTLDQAVRKTIGYMGARHDLGALLRTEHPDWR